MLKEKVYLGLLLICLGFIVACAGQPTPTNLAPATAMPVPPPQVSISPDTGVRTVPLSLPPVTRTVSRTPTAAPARPNIILILTDDQTFEDVAFMPQLKATLADKGVSFSNFFVADSLCCPSRASILRGQYPHNTKILGNVLPAGGFQKFYALQEEKSTIATWLHDAGYRTAMIGKYLNGYPASAEITYVPPGWDGFYSPVDASAYREYNYRLNANGTLIHFGKKPQDYGTDVYARYAASFVGTALNDHTPFFLYLAPFAPHLPATPAKQDLSLFPDLKVPRTASFNEVDVSDKPRFVAKHPLLTAKKIAKLDLIYRKRILSLQAVDRMIGALVKQLEQAGALDNTYIFFSSDNGFHLGQHRLEAGKTTAFETDIHVPLIVRGPGISAGSVVPQFGLNIDLAPTWLDLAGVKSPDAVDGRSLVSLLHGDTPTVWRRMFSIENGLPGAVTLPQVAATPTPGPTEGMVEAPDPLDDRRGHHQDRKLLPYRGLRTDSLKFVRYADGELELYDLRTDPEEMQNLAARAAPTFINTLLEQLATFAACRGLTCRAAEDAVPPSLDSIPILPATATP